MKHCPFCAETLNPVTVFCRSCARRLPWRLPSQKPSSNWRRFAIRYVQLEPERQKASWARLDRSQRSYASSLGLDPPGAPAKLLEGSGPFGLIAYLALCVAGFLALVNLSPGSPAKADPDLSAPPMTVGARPVSFFSQPAMPDPGSREAAEKPPVDRLRVKSHANIRSRPSLDAPVVDKARSGDLLGFLGREGDWFVLPPSQPHAGRYIHKTVVVLVSPAEARRLRANSDASELGHGRRVR